MMARLMGLKTVSVEQLQQALRGPAPLTVADVNPRASWLGARIPGALHLDPLGFGAAELPADRDALLVFYCSNPLCRKAPGAARRAEALGYTQVRVLSAGISGWRAAGLDVASG